MGVIAIYTFLLLIVILEPEGVSTESLRGRIPRNVENDNQLNVILWRPKCKKNTRHFCIDVDNYPKRILDIILPRFPKYFQFFGNDELMNETLSYRIDDNSVGRALCETLERVIYPQAGITQESEWSLIINHAKYRQGVRVEECVKPDLPCSIDTSFPFGIRHKCTQKYGYRQLLSVDYTGRVVKELFRLPSCCMCTLSYV